MYKHLIHITGHGYGLLWKQAMHPMRIAPLIQVTEPERWNLHSGLVVGGRLLGSSSVPRSSCWRAEGHDNQHIAPLRLARVGKPWASGSASSPSDWSVNLAQHAAEGPPSQSTPSAHFAILKTTTQTKPPTRRHPLVRPAAWHGIYKHQPHASVKPVWTSHGLQPHRVRAFKLSQDPHFQDKLEDVVGLYLHPPEHAVVLCVDEQKPDPGTGSHPTWLAAQAWALRHDDTDHKRHGTPPRSLPPSMWPRAPSSPPVGRAIGIRNG